MTHQDIIDSCRFYKEESTCPYEVMDECRYFWEAEKMYVEQMDESAEDVNAYLMQHVTNATVRQICNAEDVINPMLSLFLFNYYENFAGDYHTMDEIIVGFRDWYGLYKSLNVK